MSEPVIEMASVVKTFGDVRALDGLDLDQSHPRVLSLHRHSVPGHEGRQPVFHEPTPGTVLS